MVAALACARWRRRSARGQCQVPRRYLAGRLRSVAWRRAAAGLAWPCRGVPAACDLLASPGSTRPVGGQWRPTAAAGRRSSDVPSRSRRWQGDNGSIGRGRTQLDVMGHDPRMCVALTRHTPGLRTPHGQNAVFTWREMENPQVSGYSDGSGWAHCKTVGLAYVGSNPTPATQNPRSGPVPVFPDAGSDACPGAVR